MLLLHLSAICIPKNIYDILWIAGIGCTWPKNSSKQGEESQGDARW